MSIQDRANQLSDRIARLSDRTEQAVTRRLDERLAEVERGLLALWVAAFGALDQGPENWHRASRYADAAVAVLVNAMDPDLVDREGITAALDLAYELGVVDAIETAPELALRVPGRRVLDPLDLTLPVDEQLARTALQLTGDALLDQTFDAVTAALRTARHSVNRIRATLAHDITAATNDGIRAVAETAGTHVIWLAERDACLTCLAYAGATALPGQAFPSELTFASRPMRAYGPLLGPPRHPRCRCVLQLWDPSDEAVADALKREAKRAVLRGWAGGESTRERLNAAERLLQLGAGMPKSVEQAARRAIRTGRFPEDRPFK